MRHLLSVRIGNQVPRYPAPRRVLADVLCDAYAARRRHRATLTVMLTTDAGIAALNRRFKSRRGATDVLAFPDHEPDPATALQHLGDIVLSVETARRAARRLRVPVQDEVVLYALHGLLHLLGMRDGTPAGVRAMMRAQAEIFTRWELRFAMK